MRNLYTLILLLSIMNSLSAQLEFSVSTDKNVYHYGDYIYPAITAINFGSVPETLGFTSSCQVNYYIDSVSFMHHDSIIIVCADGFTDRIIAPNDSTIWGDKQNPLWGFHVTTAGNKRLTCSLPRQRKHLEIEILVYTNVNYNCT